MKIGDHRFYPPHGVVTLVAVEERDLAGIKDEFHVLEVARGGTVLLPSKTVKDEEMRALVSASKAKDLLKRVKSKAKRKAPADLGGKALANHYDAQLKSGDAAAYTEVLRDLMMRGATQKISATEQDLMQRARSYFVTELATVLKVDQQKIQTDLDGLFAKLAGEELDKDDDEEDEDEDEEPEA
jgi:CarD family transcriptional regulator